MRQAEFSIAQILAELSSCDLLPAIIFRTARAQCDQDAEAVYRDPTARLPASQRVQLLETIDRVIQRYEMDRQLIETHPQYRSLTETGVGAHHAGQLLMWRLLLEELMAAGLLRILIATGTVAAGVDFPARTVVITAHSRRGSNGYTPLSASEFQQMSGRAGRRGRDTVGFCLAAPAQFCDARALLRIAQSPPEPLRSAYFPSPSTVLNLLRYRNVDDLRFTVSRSLAAFMDRKQALSVRAEAEELLLSFRPELAAHLTETRAKIYSPSEEEENTADVQFAYKNINERKSAKRYRRYLNQARTLEEQQNRLLNATLEGLEQLGYVEKQSLSEKGYWAASLCTSIVLELSELIESDALEGISAERLAAMVAALSADSHRKYLEAKQYPITKAEIGLLGEIITRVQSYNIPGVSESREVSPSAALTVVEWMARDTWHSFRSVLLLSGVAEGDAARLISQTAEHLNQLSRLEGVHQKLAFRAEEAKRKLLRPPLTEVLE